MSDMNSAPPPPPPPPPPGGGGTPPPPPPPGAGPPPAGGANPPKNWMGITSLIASILGIVLICCFGVGFFLSIAGLVIGLLGRKAADAGEANNRSLANAGFIIGIVGVALNVLSFLLGVVFGVLDFAMYG